MADLIDRINGLPDGSRPSINMHKWVGLQRLYAFGVFTRLEIANAFDITGNVDEERQATQIANNIDAQSNANSKALYIARVESILYCIQDRGIDTLYHNQDGSLNKAKIFTDLQIAG